MNTKQQEFDAVVTHLFTQGRPAMANDGDTCMYRGVNGTSCAVGCRIPNDVYTPEMDVRVTGFDGTNVTALLQRFGPALPEELTAYKTMFARLQEVHDGCMTNAKGEFELDELERRLQNVANDHGLTFTRP